MKVKSKIPSDLVAALGSLLRMHPDNVIVVFKETTWENWAFGGGRMIHS